MLSDFFVNIRTRNLTFALSSTYDAVLDTEAQLVFQIWSLDEDSSNRGTTDDVHLHLNLVLQALKKTQAQRAC